MGNFWDWGTPYFISQVRNFFNLQSMSWSSGDALGHPIAYNSSYYFNLLASLDSFLKPEYWILLIIILAFCLYTYFVCRISQAEKYCYFSIFLTIIAVFNTAIYYKLQAGHLDYIIALPFLTGLIYNIVFKLKKDFSSYLALSILLAFVGIQIQFFIFAAIFILIYFLFNKDKFSWKYCWLLIVIPLLINLPWLSNFLVGANSISATSQGATQMLFADTAFASPIRIFFMIFSPATNIQYAYDRWMLIYFGIFTAMVYGSIAYYYFNRIKNKELRIKDQDKGRIINILVTNFVVFTLLGTGYFQKIPIPFIKTFYPMFRESGHFAPIIILFEILILAFILPVIFESIKKYQIKSGRKFLLITYNLLLTTYLIVFVAINAYTFYKYLPRVNFSEARKQFQPFENFGASDNSVYRVLTYPFWNQYGFNDVADVVKKGKLLNNSGWDSFIEFSGKDHISNYQAGGQSINGTLQYRLLTTENITELEQKNVKYIYDFQNIYTSNWNLYTSPDTYDNNLSLIKNDPNFMAKLMAANPGEITKVADHIYEINNTLPRVNLENAGETQLSFQRINPTKYKVTIKNLKDTADLNFLESYHLDWNIYLGNYNLFAKPLFDSTHKETFGYANGWTINKADIISQKSNDYSVNPDGSIDVNLMLYFWPQTAFEISLVVSILAILSCATYLLYAMKRKK